MINYIALVKEFMLKFDQNVPQTPNIDNVKVNQLRVDLIQEELDELKAALEAGNLPAVLDALVDLQYVLSGAVLAFGMEAIFNEGFREVQGSNLSKGCASLTEAEETIRHYNQLGVKCYSKENKAGTMHLVKRSKDHKLLKSVNYKPANFEQFFEKPTVIDEADEDRDMYEKAKKFVREIKADALFHTVAKDMVDAVRFHLRNIPHEEQNVSDGVGFKLK